MQGLALHFGPDPAFAGGIGTVMRLMVQDSLGDDGRVIPTWRPTSRRDRLGLVARALACVGRSPDMTVIHGHLSQGGSFVREGLVLAAGRRRSRPVVATVHGSRFVPFARSHPRLVAAALRQAHVVTCLTTETRDTIAALVPDADVRLVPNPLPVDPDPTPANETDEIVLFAGEVGKRKGADVLAEAWVQVAAQRTTARCVVVGPRTAWSFPSLDRLQLLDSVDAVEMRGLLRSARVVTLPSRAEALPMFLLEAIGARRPFVSTTVGQIASVARGGNVLVAPGDVDGLASALISFLGDPSLAREVGELGFAENLRERGTIGLDQRWQDIYRQARGAIGH
jgi:glycosyltransferase involved in cell wall biosynthesis